MKSPDDSDFSLVLGGPLFQLMRRAHLSGDALTLVRRRVIALSALTWLPLAVLSAMQGQLLGGTVTVPFLLDVEVHARFLIALPLLVSAELVVHRRMRHVVRLFLERRLIPEQEMPRFEAAIASAVRLRNSVLAEVLMLAFVYGVGVLVIWRQYISLDAASWYVTPSGDGSTLSLAGKWFGYVSLPIFQFLLLRWYFRLAVWTRCLWQVSRIELSLLPSHPDRVGGLSFLSRTAYAFTPIAAAHGTLLAGQLASRIFYLGASLMAYQAEIVVVVIFLVAVVLGPLLMFMPQLAQAKRQGLREFGTLAERYVREFDQKWLRGGAPPGEPLVGSADIQSLADLGNSYDVVNGMRFTPITTDNLLQLVVATLAPIAPLLLTMMPLEQLVKTLGRALF